MFGFGLLEDEKERRAGPIPSIKMKAIDFPFSIMDSCVRQRKILVCIISSVSRVKSLRTVTLHLGRANLANFVLNWITWVICHVL